MYKYCTAVCRKYSAGGPVLEAFGGWSWSFTKGKLPGGFQVGQAQASGREAHGSRLSLSVGLVGSGVWNF